jgi:hypothetical protein
VLDSQTTCELLTAAVDNYIPVTSTTEQHSRTGRACTLASTETRVSGLVTHRGRHGLVHLPAHDATAEIAHLSLGRLPARTERGAGGCAAAAEVVPGRTLRVLYTNRRAGNRACSVAAMLLERAVQHLLDHSVPNAG